MTSKVPSGGIYTTACSSDDVRNIPTNGHLFFIFTVSAWSSHSIDSATSSDAGWLR